MEHFYRHEFANFIVILCTYYPQYGDTGRAKEIKKIGTAVSFACQGYLPCAILDTRAIGSSALD